MLENNNLHNRISSNDNMQTLNHALQNCLNLIRSAHKEIDSSLKYKRNLRSNIGLKDKIQANLSTLNAINAYEEKLLALQLQGANSLLEDEISYEPVREELLTMIKLDYSLRINDTVLHAANPTPFFVNSAFRSIDEIVRMYRQELKHLNSSQN